MKKVMSVILTLVFFLAAPCYAGNVPQEEQHELHVVTETTVDEKMDAEVDTIGDLTETEEAAEIVDASVNVIVCTEHDYEAAVGDWVQTDCCELEKQTVYTCKNCGHVKTKSQYASNEKHIGPYSYEEETWDGVEYRVKYCNRCGEMVDHNPI